MKLSRTIMMLIIATFLVASFGCQAAQRPEPTGYNNNNRTQDNRYQSNQVGYGMDNGYNYGNFNQNADWGIPGIREMDPSGWNSDNLWNGGQSNELTQRLEQRVEQLTGINDCTVVVQNDTCYVAIDGAENGQTLNTTSNRLEEQVRQICAEEGQFTNIIVSDDNSFGEDLNTIADEIRNGRPVTDFEDTLRDLGQNLVPMRFR